MFDICVCVHQKLAYDSNNNLARYKVENELDHSDYPCHPGVIPCQINQEFSVTSWILTKLGVFVVPVELITHANF